MQTRRGFLGTLAAMIAAPKALFAAKKEPDSTCRPVFRRGDVPLVLWGDGRHDDTAALQALLDSKTVRWSNGHIVDSRAPITGKHFRISNTLFCNQRASSLRLEDCFIYSDSEKVKCHSVRGFLWCGTDRHEPTRER